MRFTRKDWGARARRHEPGRLVPDEVDGVALHWPAMGKVLTGIPAVMASLRSWQDYHMDTHGWSDIAYQEAVDQWGNFYALRGLRNRSAANGNTTTNGTYGAILLVLAAGEHPSPQMIETVRRRIARHRLLFLNSTKIVGHGDLKSTTCPGPIVQAMIDDGRFDPKDGAR